MQCPACQRPLRRFNVGTVALDGCDGGCGGIWFDFDELVKTEREQTDPSAPVPSPRQNPAVTIDDYALRACPKCDGVMLDKKLYSLGSGVILDRCLQCQGVWLDCGELEKIRESLHPRPARPRPVSRQPGRRLIPITFAMIDQVRTLHLGPR